MNVTDISVVGWIVVKFYIILYIHPWSFLTQTCQMQLIPVTALLFWTKEYVPLSTIMEVGSSSNVRCQDSPYPWWRNHTVGYFLNFVKLVMESKYVYASTLRYLYFPWVFPFASAIYFHSTTLWRQILYFYVKTFFSNELILFAIRLKTLNPIIRTMLDIF